LSDNPKERTPSREELERESPAWAAFERAAADRNVPVDLALSQAMDMWVEAQRVQAWFEVRRAAVDWKEFDRLLSDRSRGEGPRAGDELPPGYRSGST
jgi:hypothetical protein